MGDGGVAKSFPFILRFCEARRDIARCVDDVGCKLEKCAGSPSFGTRQRVLAAPLVAASCWFEKKYRSFVPGLRYEASAAAHLALPAVGCRWASFTRAACAPAIPQMIGSIIAFSVIVEYRGSSEYNYIVSPQYQWLMSCLRRTFLAGRDWVALLEQSDNRLQCLPATAARFCRPAHSQLAAQGPLSCQRRAQRVAQIRSVGSTAPRCLRVPADVHGHLGAGALFPLHGAVHDGRQGGGCCWAGLRIGSGCRRRVLVRSCSCWQAWRVLSKGCSGPARRHAAPQPVLARLGHPQLQGCASEGAAEVWPHTRTLHPPRSSPCSRHFFRLLCAAQARGKVAAVVDGLWFIFWLAGEQQSRGAPAYLSSARMLHARPGWPTGSCLPAISRGGGGPARLVDNSIAGTPDALPPALSAAPAAPQPPPWPPTC